MQSVENLLLHQTISTCSRLLMCKSVRDRVRLELLKLSMRETEKENFTSPFSQHWPMRTRLGWYHQPRKEGRKDYNTPGSQLG